MTRLGLRLVPHAVEQLDAADQSWRENRDKAPDLLSTELAEAVERLRSSPDIGAEYENDELPGTRRYLLRPTRFHLYYVVRDDLWVIVAVWSAIRGHGPPLPG